MIKSALILTLLAAPLLAQTERSAALGDRVRLKAPKAGYRQLTGEVIATTPDVIQLRLDGGPTEVAVQRVEIQELLLSIASRRNAQRGAVIGTVTGAVVAFLYGPKHQDTPYSPPTRTPVINIISAAIGGGAIGGLIGYYTRSDTWVILTPQP
jgi:hypothetical protein